MIQQADHGWLEWLHDTHPRAFRLVHHAPHSPGYPDRTCPRFLTEQAVYGDRLDHFTGPDGFAALLRLLRLNPDPQEWSEIVNRLHEPHYEEVRACQRDALAHGSTHPAGAQFEAQTEPATLLASVHELTEHGHC